MSKRREELILFAIGDLQCSKSVAHGVLQLPGPDGGAEDGDQGAPGNRPFEKADVGAAFQKLEQLEIVKRTSPGEENNERQ